MPAKPALILLLVAMSLSGRAAGADAPLTAKAPLPTVLLYPATPGDVAALVDLRTRLRLDERVEVLTYDPESAAIQRASTEAAHPEWLDSAPVTDAGRMVLARALGAAFYAVVSPGRAADSTHVEVVETAPAARTFDWTGSNRQFGVRAIESQVADAIGHPVSYPADTSPLLTPAPSVVASAPSVVASAPSVVASAPSVVASAPTGAPIVIALPVSVPPVQSLPLPPVQAASRPLRLPVLVAQVPIVPALPPPDAAVAVPVKVSPLPALPPALPSPELAAGPLPETTAAVPVSKIAAAVPEPKLAPLPLAAPVLPKSPLNAGPQMGGPQVALLPKPTSPLSELPHSQPAPVSESPVPAPAPPAAITVRKRDPKAEDMTAIQPLLAKGDSALDGGDAVSAIALYRQAINGAPLSVVPRLKLAQAYQKDGLNDRALDEARRALEIAPDSAPVQQFLSDMDQQTGTTAGALIRDRATLERSPDSPSAHAALADALWNSGDLGGAEAEYKTAQALAPAGDHAADAQLAQLYAAEARYGDCLAMLQVGGKGGYALAIQIVKNRAETLGSTLSASRDTFAAGKSTREQFYDDAKKLSAEAQALAEFVGQVTPPDRYRLSHLHRVLSTNLLAQEAATLVSFIETNDARQSDSIALLERGAATEMLTAQATEEKLGLWREK